MYAEAENGGIPIPVVWHVWIYEQYGRNDAVMTSATALSAGVVLRRC